ncbi:hypothetical protein ACHFCA_15990 [Delftia tsuruhatensis]
MELHPHPAVQELLRASVDGSPAVARVGRWMAAHPVLAVTLSAEEVANACGAPWLPSTASPSTPATKALPICACTWAASCNRPWSP